jgi:hypothetical protein
MAATDALQALAQVLRTAPQPVTLSESLLSGAGATPPQGLDAALAKAFRSPGANGLGVTSGPMPSSPSRAMPSKCWAPAWRRRSSGCSPRARR